MLEVSEKRPFFMLKIRAATPLVKKLHPKGGWLIHPLALH
jgi:hypothetical protein